MLLIDMPMLTMQEAPPPTLTLPVAHHVLISPHHVYTRKQPITPCLSHLLLKTGCDEHPRARTKPQHHQTFIGCGSLSKTSSVLLHTSDLHTSMFGQITRGTVPNFTLQHIAKASFWGDTVLSYTYLAQTKTCVFMYIVVVVVVVVVVVDVILTDHGSHTGQM
jgi:hypothetical protein